MDALAKAQLVKQLGRMVGFDLVGVTAAEPLERGAYYREWLAAGYHGTMAYLGRNVRFRLNPAELVPGARSVICVAVRYARADAYITPSAMQREEVRLGVVRLPVATTWPRAGSRPLRGHGDADMSDAHKSDPAPACGLVAQYARGRDYHRVLHGMLAQLVERLRAACDEPFAARLFVDTGPVLERELAARAGLGWIGKNTCLLNGQSGSYLFLGEVVTDLQLEPDSRAAERCGSCRRCVDACPTEALRAPYTLDARRCISYLTIEHRAKIDESLKSALGVRVYGCDICQQVCPYNARAPRATHPQIAADLLPSQPDLLDLVRLTAGGYRRLVRDTAAQRASRRMWQRNASIALQNVGSTSR